MNGRSGSEVSASSFTWTRSPHQALVQRAARAKQTFRSSDTVWKAVDPAQSSPLHVPGVHLPLSRTHRVMVACMCCSGTVGPLGYVHKSCSSRCCLHCSSYPSVILACAAHGRAQIFEWIFGPDVCIGQHTHSLYLDLYGMQYLLYVVSPSRAVWSAAIRASSSWWWAVHCSIHPLLRQNLLSTSSSYH